MYYKYVEVYCENCSMGSFGFSSSVSYPFQVIDYPNHSPVCGEGSRFKEQSITFFMLSSILISAMASWMDGKASDPSNKPETSSQPWSISCGNQKPSPFQKPFALLCLCIATPVYIIELVHLIPNYMKIIPSHSYGILMSISNLGLDVVTFSLSFPWRLAIFLQLFS